MNVGTLISETFSLTGKWLPRALPLGLLAAAATAFADYADNMGYYFGTPMPGLYWGMFCASIVVDTFLAAAILRGMVRGEWTGITGAQFGMDEANYALSAIATLLIWLLSIVIVLLPVVLSCLLVIASSGVDLELLAESGGLDDIPLLPRAISMSIFVFGLAVCIAVLARLAPWGAGVMAQKKIVAMEAFSWTKGHTLSLTCAGLVILTILIAFYVAIFFLVYPAAERADLLQDGVLMSLPLLTLSNLAYLPIFVSGAAFSMVVYRGVQPVNPTDALAS